MYKCRAAQGWAGAAILNDPSQTIATAMAEQGCSNAAKAKDDIQGRISVAGDRMSGATGRERPFSSDRPKLPLLLTLLTYFPVGNLPCQLAPEREPFMNYAG